MSLLTKMLPQEPLALQSLKKHTNYSKVLHTQGNRERKHILKLQEGVVLVPCLILDASASLFCSHRLPRHQCCYGSQSDPKHCKFIFSGKYLRMFICLLLKYMLQIYIQRLSIYVHVLYVCVLCDL